MADETPTPTVDNTVNPISNPFHLAHAITNIKSLIPLTLDIKNPNYQWWSHFFTITVGRFSLSDLLHGKPCPSNISLDDWERGDYLLQSWIYSTISDDLSSMVFSKTTYAHQLWTSLASLLPTINITALSHSRRNLNLSRKVPSLFMTTVKISKIRPINWLISVTLYPTNNSFYRHFTAFPNLTVPLPISSPSKPPSPPSSKLVLSSRWKKREFPSPNPLLP